MVKYPSWWLCGLAGMAISSVAVIVTIIKRCGRFPQNDVPWFELPCFIVGILAIGFGLGLVVWLMLPFSRRFGEIGDAFVGIVVMVLFFLMCMIAFDPSLITPDPSRGLPMFGLAVVVGTFLGVSVGKDIRKYIAEMTKSDEIDDHKE